jgi:hypothetical protein
MMKKIMEAVNRKIKEEQSENKFEAKKSIPNELEQAMDSIR